MNIEDITRQEFGAFLSVVGREMLLHDLSLSAALDGLSDQNMLPRLTEKLALLMAPYPGETEKAIRVRAADLLTLDLEDVLYLLGNLE